MDNQSLLEYLSISPSTIPTFQDTSPSRMTLHPRYCAEDITQVVNWPEFNYETIIQRYGDVLNSKQIRRDPFMSPPGAIRNGSLLCTRFNQLLQPRVRRSLRAAFEELAPQLQHLSLVPITIDYGEAAAYVDRWGPDTAFVTLDGPIGNTPNRAPGFMKVSWKWRSEYRHSENPSLQTKYKQVLSQVNFYMGQHNARHGFVLTNTELVAVKCLEENGHLAVSEPIPWTAGGPGQLSVLMGLWYIGMLAAEEANWACPKPRDCSAPVPLVNTTIHLPSTSPAGSADGSPSRIDIVRELKNSDASSIFEVDLDGRKYVLKLFHDDGDRGYTERGRDLNRFRCESTAYQKLLASGVCERGLVPKFYGYIGRMDPAAFYPALQHFANDEFHPRAILLEYLPRAESLNCVNYSEALYPQAIEGIEEIHRAGVLHEDVYPKNLLLVRGHPDRDRLVWIDFDVASTFTDFGPEELEYCGHEVERVKGFGEMLRQDQAEGLPPNTKFY